LAVAAQLAKNDDGRCVCPDPQKGSALLWFALTRSQFRSPALLVVSLPNQAEGSRRISLVMGSISFSCSFSPPIFNSGCFAFKVAGV
jgi:hypothetical protein